MIPVPDMSQSEESTVDATARTLGAALVTTGLYMLVSSTNCWIRQGQAKLVTCATQANMADTDTLVITTASSTKTYEFDKAGNGVTAGNVQVNISTDTTAATVAARLRTAILANQPELRVIDPADGTLKIDVINSRVLTITENVAHASFTVGVGVVQASAAAGSMLVPALMPIYIDGTNGGQVGIIRNTADGVASITPILRY